ncbi:MAG: hypothetical protein V4719_25930 [Planctomycetota bacterium]
MNAYQMVVMTSVFLCGAVTLQAQEADIRHEPGGKRLLFIDGDDIRHEPGGKRRLFIDGNELRTEPGGKVLLYVDGDDIRPKFGGIRLACIDDDSIRRNPTGKRLLFIDGDDLRPEPGGKRLYFIDGKVSRIQLIAALYLLMPELFKLTPKEEAALQAAMKAAEAESDAAMANVLLGKFDVLNSSNSDWGGGVVSTVAGKDGFHYLDMKLKKANLSGIGVKRPGQGQDELWLAFAPEGAVALAVYEIDGGKLTGQWIPMNAAKDGKTVLGHETLQGPATLSGTFKIVSAKAPNDGAEYSGTVTLAPYKPADGNSSDLFDLYSVTWTFGTVKVPGVAAKVKTTDGKSVLIAASGTKGDFAVGHVTCESATLAKGIDFLTNKGAAGYIVWTKQNE